MQLDQIPAWLQNVKAQYKSEVFLYGWFNNTYIDSDMSMDDVYIAVFGLPKEKYLAKKKREQERLEKQLKKDSEAFEKSIQEWKNAVIAKYGSMEKYREALHKDRCKKGHRLIPRELWADWDDMIKNNQNSYRYVDEVLFYLGYFKKKKPRRFFSYLKKYFSDCDHSGSTGNWTLRNLEHFGGRIGKELSHFIQSR
jgi:hypothetical protein